MSERILRALMQLFAIEISSGIGTQPMNSAPWSAVHRYMGQSEKNEYDSSIREWEFWDRKSTNRMQYWVLGFSVIILFLSAYSGRMKSEFRFFVLLVLLSLLVNAFVTGALANVFDRLQARVTWLLVLPALLILWELAENWQNKLGESIGE